MKPLLIILCLLSLSVYAQTSERVYYFKDQNDKKEVDQTEARYALHTRQNQDGSVTNEWHFIRTNAIIQSESYSGDVPVGLWIYANKNGKIRRQLDYRFELKYDPTDCPPGNRYKAGQDSWEGSSTGFMAPQLVGEKRYTDFLVKELYYPVPAREAGITGRVLLKGRLTKEGDLIDLVIVKSAGKLLDAEAMRVMRGAKKWTPARLNGQAIDLCITAPITFLLD